jgi:N-acyl-D-aspartate/D-glutamate deacylase
VNAIAPCWDTLIRNATVFDGSGDAPRQEDLAIAAGRIAARGVALPVECAREVVDASGRWLMPGLLDIHTHLDLEVEVNPGLPEVVRHGTTTVLVGNCSLGVAFGPQLRGNDNPVIDCFTRVENMPKRVLQKCVDKMHWDNPADYLAHFAAIPLGPNIAPLVPHSMLRIEVMGGIDASITRAPTEAELERMAGLLTQCLQQGYVGFSTDSIIFHYLANEPHKHARIPTQFAGTRELKLLTNVVRAHDRVWQATPDSGDRLNAVRRFALTSGRLYRKPLRVSALTALDFAPMPRTWKQLLALARFLNSPLMQGRFHLQALSTNFRLWSDGMVSPFFEEFETTRALIACEAEDRAARQRLLADPAFAEKFLQEWNSAMPENRTWLNRLGIGAGATTFELDPEKMHIDSCPVAGWQGRTVAEVLGRLRQFQVSNGRSGADDEAERAIFARCPAPIRGAAEFMLTMFREFDRDFRWWMDAANNRPEVVKQMLFDPNTLPGFNDSGAHITNLAFYDGNLLTLKIAAQESLALVATAVKRLTRDPAEFFGLDVGRIDPGCQADVTLINPDALARYDSNASRRKVYHEIFENDCLVNRSDGVVEQVYIRGTRVWEDAGRFTAALGSDTLGRALTFAGRQAT